MSEFEEIVYPGYRRAVAFGQRLRRDRLAAGLTMRTLAGACRVGVPHVSKMEAGRENPSAELIGRMATVLGQDADEYLLTAGQLPEWVADLFASDPALWLARLKALTTT